MEISIFNGSAPVMPKLGKGTEILKLILSQVSKDMREPIAPMVFPPLASHLQGVEVMYSSNRYKELHGQIGHLIGPSGIGKDQLNTIIESICHSFRSHDAAEMRKLQEWQSLPKKEREKSKRPVVSIFNPPADTTKPAFKQNAIACEMQDEHAQYLNLPEVEMLDSLCGGKKASGQMLINIHDVKHDGALRATGDGVSGDPVMRANINISSTEEAARDFYKHDVRRGKAGRVSFAYKPRGERKGKIPREGDFDETYQEQLEVYIKRLQKASGRFIIKPLNRVADKLAAELAKIADLADDDTLFDLGKRCITGAWKKGALLWLLNDQTWTSNIGNFVEWFFYYDLWSKCQILGDMFAPKSASASNHDRGPQNMLMSLPATFSQTELEALRAKLEKPADGAIKQLRVWMSRGFVTYCNTTGLYTKTEKFLNRK